MRRPPLDPLKIMVDGIPHLRQPKTRASLAVHLDPLVRRHFAFPNISRHASTIDARSQPRTNAASATRTVEAMVIDTHKMNAAGLGRIQLSASNNIIARPCQQRKSDSSAPLASRHRQAPSKRKSINAEPSAIFRSGWRACVSTRSFGFMPHAHAEETA